jgi:hypothetical protein
MDLESCQHLQTMLGSISNLSSLHIDSCDLGDDQLLAIASGLRDNLSLSNLFLKKNSYGPDALAEALKAMNENNTIQTLLLEEFEVNGEVIEAFDALLQNPLSAIQKLGINSITDIMDLEFDSII